MAYLHHIPIDVCILDIYYKWIVKYVAFCDVSLFQEVSCSFKISFLFKFDFCIALHNSTSLVILDTIKYSNQFYT